jgi:RND family efflux transporter MFP subunit
VAYAAREAFLPSLDVRVAAVIVKSGVAVPIEGTVVVQAPGWVEADPFPIAVSALADGVVCEMFALEGQRVERDEVVARLVDDDARIALDHAKATLAQRRASVLAARARLDEAERNWAHPIDLTRKRAMAQAMLAEKVAQLQRWPHELARDQAELVYLEREFERIEPLVERGTVTDIEVVRARQNREAQRARVEVTRESESILQARVRGLQAEVTAATENLELRIVDTRALAEAQAALQLAQAAQSSAEALRDDAALHLDRMAVRSPADGVVMNRMAEPGSKLMLQMDSPYSAQVARLYDPDRLQVRVDVPLVEAAQISVGQRAEVIVDVLPQHTYAGRVTRIVHEADVQKNTLQVKVAIEDPTAELKPEMLARARFLGSPNAAASDAGARPTGVVFVPRSAIREGPDGTHAWVADVVTKQAHRRTLILGRASEGDWLAVVKGLQAGDRVIMDPPQDLQSGQRITAIEE